VEAFDAALAAWQAFFSAQLSAGATLLGLVFVGLSLNLTRILADPLLPVRAEVALIVLVLQFVAASAMLVPDQPRGALAAEILAVGGIAWLATTAMNGRLVRQAPGRSSRRLALQNLLLLQVATVPYLLGGALLLAGAAQALHAIAFGMTMCLVKAALDAWVLLVEINR
jgi:modulator of FtsH protease